jgi:esterase/lipase superfamily enzyme
MGVRQELFSPAIGTTGTVIAHGHYGRPLIAFGAEDGDAAEWEREGMVAAVAPLLEAGRIKLYCVDSLDAASWSARDKPLEERAREHLGWESWLLEQVVPFVHHDCGGVQEILLAGVSMGAFHAANLALKHAHTFPLAIGLSGNYEPSAWHAWGDRGDAAYFNDPMAYVANLDGPHLEWLQQQLSILLVVGQGAWEHTPTGALESTRRFADLLWSKGVRCELDVWGYDVPHDWPSWQRQLAHHLPRFC